MTHIFRGTGVALVTTFLSNGDIDFPALEKMVNHVIDNGVNYIVALGTTAETPTLSTSEKKEILATIIKVANNRVPIVCGIGGNNTQHVIQDINSYDLTGVSGILSVVPYYNKPTQEGIFQHFKAIAEATEKPIILYNVPGRTVANMSAETTLKLAHSYSHIVAVKEASGNMAQCMDLIAQKPKHFAVLSGDDDLVLPQIAMGMEGVISVAANCFTKDFCHMVQAALNHNLEEAQTLHYKLLPAIRLLFAEGNPAGVKAVLHHMGLIEENLRLPLVPVGHATRAKILETYNQL